MRKSNSILKTAFVSEAGAQLANNDYFAYIELDDYACYVLASGITDFETSDAAKNAVEHLILSFEEKPSMAKTTLLQYMKETNERLLNSLSATRLKASVIMLVTDYEKFRYVSAGNVRLRMYRQGRFFMKSSDMSLANDLIKKGESDTPLDRHEERHNLYAYLGKRGSFEPHVSKKFKMLDADIILLYSQGLWENVDEQELDEILSEATDNPQESVDILEEVLLSRQPNNLQCYTVVAIFANKTYRDPERERKRLRCIKIACVVVLIIIVAALVIYFINRWHNKKVDALHEAMISAQEYMNAGNFSRAQTKCTEALEMAEDLDHDLDAADLKDDLMMLDNLLRAEEFFNNRHYQSAYEDYMRALQISDATNNTVRDYIQGRLDRIEDQSDMSQFMNLGDVLFRNGDYDGAEGMYIRASEKASAVHDVEGRNAAFDALEKIYDKRAELRKDALQQLDNKKQQAMADAMRKGDDLLAAGDIEGAQKAYLDARNLSDNIADRAATSAALDKVADARVKKDLAEKHSEEALQKRNDDAEQLEKKGDDAMEAGDYLSAQMYYVSATDKYNALSNPQRAQFVQSKYDAAQEQFLEAQNKKHEAETVEQKARDFYVEKNYAEARSTAEQAKELYNALNMKSKAEEMDILMQQIATDNAIADALK